jgi:hypothetical protein
VTDDELTDAWLSGAVFPGGIRHEQHLRIAWVLHQRYGEQGARARLLTGTEQACRVHGSPEKFDPVLTERWARAVADAGRRDGFGHSADELIAAHPDLARGDRFRRPSASTPSDS